ncbi:MAG: hypothetical protein PVH61_43730 [Candidatus Aminicenantes bacterium]|jgi:hypothetical protein
METKKKNILIATIGNRDVKLFENNNLKDLKPPRSKGEEIFKNLKQYIDAIKIPLLGETFKYLIYKEYQVDSLYLVVNKNLPGTKSSFPVFPGKNSISITFKDVPKSSFFLSFY